MNSRERVLLALNHQEADRIPIDFGGMFTSIHIEGYKKLLEYLNLPDEEISILDQFQMIVYPSKEILKKFRVDILPVFANPGTGWELKIDPETDSYRDEWGITYKRPPGGYFYDPVGYPLNPLIEGTLEELKKYKFPDPYDLNRIKGLKDNVKKMYENTDKAMILFQPQGSIFEHSLWLRGMENYYMELSSNMKYVEELSERLLEYMLSWWDNILNAVKDYVQVVQVGGDLAGQDGPLFDPKIYRKIFKPRDRKIVDLIHKKAPKIKVFMHNCGAIYEYMPDIIEIGIDIINPVQLSAKNMESDRLKREFGKDIIFWGGGADATRVMTLFSPEKLTEEVKKRISDLAPGGGYIFAPVHNIQYNVPPQNVVAFYEAGYKYGKYPIKFQVC